MFSLFKKRNALAVTANLENGCCCKRDFKRKSWLGRIAPILPAAVLVLMPKCPLCFLAWFGILGSFKMNAFISQVWGVPLVATLALFPLIALMAKSRKSGDWRPFGLGTFAAVLLIAGKFHMSLAMMFYIGWALILAAWIWSANFGSANFKT